MSSRKVNGFFIGNPNVTYLSQIIGHRGDIDSPTKVAAIVAAMQKPGLEAFIFDRTVAITARTHTTSSTFFPHVAGLTVEGNPQNLIDCTPWGRTGSVRNLFGGGQALGAGVTLAADVALGQNVIPLDAPRLAALDVSVGDKLLLTSDRVFVEGGTFVLTLTGTVAPVYGETLTQATSGATGVVEAVATTGGVTTVTLTLTTGQFRTTYTLSGSTSGALGAASAVTRVQPTGPQSDVLEVRAVSGSDVTFWPRTRDTYFTMDGARLHKMNLSKRPRYLGLAAEGPGQMTANVEGDRMFSVLWTDGLEVEGCYSGYFDNGNYFYGAQGGRISLTARFDLNGARGKNQYGVSVLGPCERVLVEDVTCWGGKHAVVQSDSLAAPGVTRDYTVRGIHAYATWNFAVAFHRNAIGAEIADNTMTECNGGIEAACIDIVTRRNRIKALPYTAETVVNPGTGLLGIGIAVTDFGMGVRSFEDRVDGGLWAFRLNTTSFPLVPGSTGPTDIQIEDFEASSFKQDGVQILSDLATTRRNVHISGIRTRRAGYNPPGAVTAAQSIEISGLFNRVTISDCDLQAETGNAGACILTSGVSDAHVRDVIYAGSAPVLGAVDLGGGVLDITSTNVRAY